jgi:putative transposase
MNVHTDHQPWPHAPPHWTFDAGMYFVTASTYHRQPILAGPAELKVVSTRLLESALAFGWSVHAWVVLSNHYHLMARSPLGSGESLRAWLRELHRTAAIALNQLANAPGRRVWMNFRESQITHQRSYLARLNYIHQNPVRHGVATSATDYEWSSARWFEGNAAPGFVESVRRFKTDRISVWDDF